MFKNSFSILGIDISALSQDNILEELQKYLLEVRSQKLEVRKRESKPLVIFTPNPEIITYAQKDHEYKRIVNTVQINIADGNGIVWAVKKMYGRKIERISGVDLMLELVKLAQEKAYTIGLIGGRGGLAVRALECLRETYPGLRGWAREGPEIEMENGKWKMENELGNAELKNEDELIKEIVRKIQNEKTDMLFVGMGAPKQEYLIDAIRSSFIVHRSYKYDKRTNEITNKPIVMMAVGGAFDYISGTVPRAPKFMRDIGLEWLFRLVIEPWRLPRQLRGAEFFWKIMTTNS